MVRTRAAAVLFTILGVAALGSTAAAGISRGAVVVDWPTDAEAAR
jgi:hypothetical protein